MIITDKGYAKVNSLLDEVQGTASAGVTGPAAQSCCADVCAAVYKIRQTLRDEVFIDTAGKAGKGGPDAA